MSKGGLAVRMAHAVRTGEVSAVTTIEAALQRFEGAGRELNAVTDIFREEALGAAEGIDRQVSTGRDPGPLAGVPFGVKDLFDVKGRVTLAGSRVAQSRPPARADATLLRRLAAAGGILCARQTMDEFAYGFTTENHHTGATRNPCDTERVAGGSSGGSAASVAAGLVPFSLGSDTNGSIRVPSSFCGIYGLKPTFGRLSRAGAFPFVASLDHVGPMAASIDDLALVYDVLQGFDPEDQCCWAQEVDRVTPRLHEGCEDLRLGRLGGWFSGQQTQDVRDGMDQVAAALGAHRTFEFPQTSQARSAAFVITAVESGRTHLDMLRARYQDYDPQVRDRLVAGACVPAAWYLQAQRFRSWFRSAVARVFEDVDVLLAPATPCVATRIGQQHMILDGVEMPVRPNLGLFTQPVSFIGLPVLVVPHRTSMGLPVGVQLIGPPGREDWLFRVAAALERTDLGQSNRRSRD